MLQYKGMKYSKSSMDYNLHNSLLTIVPVHNGIIITRQTVIHIEKAAAAYLKTGLL